MQMEIETTVLGGLPVIAAFDIEGRDPSVGIFEEYPGNITILTTKGQPAPWAEKRMSKKDWARVEDACAAAIFS